MKVLTKHFVATAAALIAALGLGRLILRANVPAVPSAAWASTGDMAGNRAGAAAVLLPDGRVLVTGGSGPGGIVATAERYSPDGGAFLSASEMSVARANHTAILLTGGRVLVAGGMTSSGAATAAVEIFIPSDNAWMAAGSLSRPRAGHTATLLADGRVLIAGGNDGGMPTDSIEVFDPFTNTFALSDQSLGTPRTAHAAARLNDGRVLIAGGFNGSNTLDTTVIFDADTDTVSAGPAMLTPRGGLSATTLLDGKVLVAGGANDAFELISSEIFDPATNAFAAGPSLDRARQGHLAFLLPHNNQVLIVGGTAGGAAVASATLYTPWEGASGSFCATGGVGGSGICASGYVAPAPPNPSRAWASGSALSFPADRRFRSGPNDGLLLVAGGSALQDASNPTKNAELYGFATVKTDKDDYAPGTMVTITGGGWEPGEWVALVLKESPNLDEHPLLDVQADEHGNIVSTEFSPDEHDLDIRFYLTAFGGRSQAQTTFTDSTNVATSTALNAISTPLLTGQSNVPFSGQVTRQSLSDPAIPSGGSVQLQVKSGSSCGGGGSSTTASATIDSSGNFSGSFTAPAVAGTYSYQAQYQGASQGSGGGATNWQKSTSSPCQIIVVNAQAATTTSAASATATFSTSNQTVALSATVTSASTVNAGTVTFTIKDGSNNTVGSPVTSGTVSGGNASANFTLPANTGASAYSINAAYSGAPSFAASSDNAHTLTVDKANQTISFDALSDKTYGDADFAVSATATSGLTVSFSSQTASVCTVSGNAVHISSQGSCTIRASQTGNTNYDNAPDVERSFSVATKTLTVNGVTANNKPYDGLATATLNTGSAALAGVVSGDSVTLDTGSATGAFADKNVGTAKTVTVSGLTIGGPSAGNYTLTQPTATANIIAATLTYVADAKTRTYSASDPAFTGTVTGFAGSDNQANATTGTLTFATLATVTSAAGSYAINGSGLTANNGNYVFVQHPGNATALAITQATLSVTASSPSVTYGDPVPAITASYSGFQNGEDATVLTTAPICSTAYTPLSGAGTTPATTCTGGSATNYTFSFVDGAVTIAMAASTTAISCPASVTFDASPQTPCSATASGAGELNTSVTVTYGNNTNAGTATADASYVGDANHDASTASQKTFTIDKASSTTAISCPASVTFDGSAQTPCSATATGGGGLNTSVTVTYGNNTNAGTATADASYAGDANHDPSTATQKTFTIDKAASVTTVSCPQSVTYNAAAQMPCSATVTGDGGLSQSLAVDYTNNTNAGTAHASAAFDGDANHNSSTALVDFAIGKANAAIVVTGYSVTYDSAAHTAGGTATGVGSDGTLAGLDLSGTAHTSAGAYPNDAWTFTDATGNYNNASGTVSDNISQAGSTTTVNCPPSVTYTGSSQTPCTVSVNGVGGLNLTPAADYSNNTNAGSATASYAFGGDANHTASSDSKAFTIDKAPSTTTVNCAPSSVTYNGAAQTPCSASVTGAGALSQALIVSYSNNTNAGTAGASASYAGDANHNSSAASQTFTIAKKSASVAANNKSKLYGAVNPPLDALVTGVMSGESLNYSLATTATTSSPAGSYPINVGLGNNPNYSVSASNGTLTVTYSSGPCLGSAGHQILDPINANGTSVFKRGSTVPAKFRVCDATGNSVGTAGVVVSFGMIQSGSGTYSDANEVVDSTTPDSAFRWSASDQQWIYNISTKGMTANKTYLFRITLNDGTYIDFQFGLK